MAGSGSADTFLGLDFRAGGVGWLLLGVVAAKVGLGSGATAGRGGGVEFCGGLDSGALCDCSTLSNTSLTFSMFSFPVATTCLTFPRIVFFGAGSAGGGSGSTRGSGRAGSEGLYEMEGRGAADCPSSGGEVDGRSWVVEEAT